MLDGAPQPQPQPTVKPEPPEERPKPDYLVQSEDMYGGEMVAPSVIGQNDRYL